MQSIVDDSTDFCNASSKMEALNKLNTSYLVEVKEDKKSRESVILTDLESMMIQFCRDACRENARAVPLVFLNDMTIDISENMV